MDELQALYASEINFQISTFYDHGFEWKLGDVLNGFKDEGKADTIGKAVAALVESALRVYPTSEFAAKRYGHKN